jgi:hypothetical protein
VEITGEPAFPIHPHPEEERGKIINGLTTIAAERGAAHSDHTALARLSRRLPQLEAGIQAPGLKGSLQGDEQGGRHAAPSSAAST